MSLKRKMTKTPLIVLESSAKRPKVEKTEKKKEKPEEEEPYLYVFKFRKGVADVAHRAYEMELGTDMTEKVHEFITERIILGYSGAGKNDALMMKMLDILHMGNKGTKLEEDLLRDGDLEDLYDLVGNGCGVPGFHVVSMDGVYNKPSKLATYYSGFCKASE